MLSKRQDLAFIITVFTLAYGFMLGSRPFAVPDEGRYAEIPREMLLFWDFVTPHLNHIVYFEKPPLFYWLQAFSLWLFGLNEWAARIPTALMGLLGCIVTYLGCIPLFNQRTARLAAFIQGTALLYFGMAHLNTLDMTLSVFITGSFLCFLNAIQQNHTAPKPIYLYGMYIFAACAVMTKGLIGIIFPCMIIGTWIMISNQWRILKHVKLLTGLLLIFLLVAPWHIMMELRNPGFNWFYFFDQHFLRYITPNAGRNKPLWFLPLISIAAFFPWICFLPQAIQYHIKHSSGPIKLLFLLWPSLIFLFFYLSHSQLIPYVLPIIPPLAILTAQYFDAQWNQSTQGLTWGLCILFTLNCLIASGFCIALYFNIAPELNQASILLIIAALIISWGSLAMLFYRTQLFVLFSLLITTTLLFFTLLIIAFPKIDDRSVKPLATLLNKIATPTARIVHYYMYYQDAPFYLQRRVDVVGWINEFATGMRFQNTTDWMLDDSTFWKRWDSSQPYYMLTERSTFHRMLEKSPHPLYIIAQTKRNMLISNQPQPFTNGGV